MGKEVVHWVPRGPVLLRVPKVTGSRTACFQPGVSELRLRALTGHFCQSLPTAFSPGSTPVSGVMRLNLAAKHYRQEVRRRRVVLGLRDSPSVQPCACFPNQK